MTVGTDDAEEPEELLRGDREDRFTFKLLKEDDNIVVDVIGGAVAGDEAGKGVRRWEQWIGGCL